MKRNVRELLSKFETSPTLVQQDLDDHSFCSTKVHTQFSFPSQETTENLGMNFSSVTSPLNQKLDSHSITVSDTSLDTKPNQTFISVSPNMSRKESGFTSVTPKLSRRSDPSSHGNSSTALPPCVRARLAKAARNKLANSTALSVSLDEGQFLSSSSEDPGQLVRVQTSPDINDTGEHGDLLGKNDGEKHKSASEMAGVTMEKPISIVAIGLDDPQRRERIERYKEERRLFLREKYRSESFRGERDEILQRLKQKAGKTVSSPTDESTDMSHSSISGSDRVRSNSFWCTGDEREREIMTQSHQGTELLSGTLEKTKERRFARRSVSPKDTDCELSGKLSYDNTSSLEQLDRQSKLGSVEVENVHHRRSSTSDKQRFNGSSTIPEKSPITCVTVRQRLGSDRMIVCMGPTSNPVINDADRPICRSVCQNQSQDHCKPYVMRGPKENAMETKRQFSNTETEQEVEQHVSLRTAAVSERLALSADKHVMRKRSTGKFEGSQENPAVEIRLSSGGEFVRVDCRFQTVYQQRLCSAHKN